MVRCLTGAAARSIIRPRPRRSAPTPGSSTFCSAFAPAARRSISRTRITSIIRCCSNPWRRRGAATFGFGLTNSAESNDLDFTNFRIYLGFTDLVEAGIETVRAPWKRPYAALQVLRGGWRMGGFGSSNLDYYSPRFCGEAGLHVRSGELGAALTRWFEEGLAASGRLQDPAAIREVLRSQKIGRIFNRWFPDIQ